MSTNEDKFILGGHEFTSRFILGSGKFSLDLVKACIPIPSYFFASTLEHA